MTLSDDALTVQNSHMEKNEPDAPIRGQIIVVIHDSKFILNEQILTNEQREQQAIYKEFYSGSSDDGSNLSSTSPKRLETLFTVSTDPL